MICEAPAVAGQILSARYLGSGQADRAARVTVQLLGVCAAVGLGLGLGLMFGLAPAAPGLMAPGQPEVQVLLQGTLPVIAAQAPLVALTLALEGVLIGAKEFKWLLGSMAIATAAAAHGLVETGKLSVGGGGAGLLVEEGTAGAAGVVGLWRGGLTTFFILRFVLAALRVADRKRGPLRAQQP